MVDVWWWVWTVLIFVSISYGLALFAQWLFGLRLIGLTGGIAVGKSTVTKHLRAEGIPVVCLDEVVHRLQRRGAPALVAIRRAFGPTVFHADGSLDRDALGSLVFSDRKARAKLNTIMKWRIFGALIQEVLRLMFQRRQRAVVVDSALLFESGLNLLCDETVAVSASIPDQLERLQARNNLSLAQAQQRLDAQMPNHRKAKLATSVIDNSGDLQHLTDMTQSWIDERIHKVTVLQLLRLVYMPRVLALIVSTMLISGVSVMWLLAYVGTSILEIFQGKVSESL
jgi:dephospho-CoA kinase